MIGKVVYRNAYGNEVVFKPGNGGYAITSFTGFTENTIDLGRSQGFGQIGETVLNEAIKSRPMTCTGEIIGDADILAARLLNTVLPGVQGTLIYNDEWELEVNPVSTPMVSKHSFNAFFQFQLLAPYPFWRHKTEQFEMLSGIEDMFEFWDLTQDYEFGRRMDKGFTVFNNLSTIEIPYRVTFRAVGQGVIGPRIVDAETYQYLGLRSNYAMTLNENITITILPNGASVTSRIDNIEKSIIGSFDISSNLYRLRPGDNILAIDAAAGKDVLDISIYTRTESAWVR